MIHIKKILKKISDVIISQCYLLKMVFSVSPFLSLYSVIVEIINNFLPLFTAYLWKLTVDEMQITYENSTVSSSLWVFLGLFIVLTTAREIVNYGSRVASEHLGNKLQQKLNLELMAASVNLECSFYDDPKNADIINKIDQYKGTVSGSISRGISLTIAGLSLIAGLFMFIPYNAILGIVYILSFLPGSIAQYIAQKKMDYYSINSIPESRKKDYYRYMLTSRDCAKELRLYGYARFIKEKFAACWNKIRKDRTEIFNKGTWAIFAATFFSLIGMIALLVWSVRSVYIGAMTIGTLSMYISLSDTVGGRFFYLSFSFPVYINITVPRILGYRQFARSNGSNGSSKATDDNPDILAPFPSVEFRNVCFRYPACDNYVLENLSFKIESREKIALLGVNGAGKSTIIKLLLRFYEPQEGQILLDGKDIKSYSLKSVRKLFGVCFQDIHKYSLSFRENIAISDIQRLKDTEAVEGAAKLSGADQIYADLPRGVDSNLTRNFDDDGYEPSGGQWQKIAISRAFFRDSNIIILDEPSSALDPEAEDYIFRRFCELCADKGGILISHRLSSVSMVDKIILIDKGRLVEYGTHEELIRNNGEYARIYNMQAEKYRMT